MLNLEHVTLICLLYTQTRGMNSTRIQGLQETMATNGRQLEVMLVMVVAGDVVGAEVVEVEMMVEVGAEANRLVRLSARSIRVLGWNEDGHHCRGCFVVSKGTYKPFSRFGR